MHYIGFDIQEAAGFLQLCIGQEAGYEATVHALHRNFDEVDTEGVLLVDAANTFNCLNELSSLLNIQ